MPANSSDLANEDAAWGAHAVGGYGGTANGDGHTGGAGGTASATAKGTSTAASSTAVGVNLEGGGGGSGTGGANGGAGGSVTATNLVSGATKLGALALAQYAFGGFGGSSDQGDGGNGGNGTSSLTVSDTTSLVIGADVEASGGYGGSAPLAEVAANGGSATATAKITGKFGVGISATAYGGGAGTGQTAGVDGNATATATGTSYTVKINSTAYTVGNGIAAATATGIANGGSIAASAQSGRYASGPVLTPVSNFDAEAGANIFGLNGNSATATAVARASDKTAIGAFNTTSQAVAQVTGDPTAANVRAILNANHSIRYQFSQSPSPSFFAIGELGGAFDTKGGVDQTGSEAVTSSVKLTVNPANISSPQDLLIGLYGGTKIGAGADSLTFDVTADTSSGPVDLLTGGPMHFASTDDYVSYFKDNPIDLGSINGINGGNAFDLHISLSETFKTASSGFYANFLLGDPPPAAAAALPIQAPSGAQAEFAKALFDGFFGNSGAMSTAGAVAVDAAHPTLAAGSMAAAHPAAHG